MALPTIGRIVHYLSHGTPIRPDGTQAFASQCRAALVTEVWYGDPERVSLAVVNPDGVFFSRGVPEGQTGGTWHWPERAA